MPLMSIRQKRLMRPSEHRTTGSKLCMVGIVACVLTFLGWAMPGSAAAQRTKDPSRKIFEQYCHRCHARSKPEGDFRVDHLSLNFTNKANRRTWLRVVEQIKSGTMPPAGEARPDDDETKALVNWIESQVAAAETSRNARQGRAVMRRLNQTEYMNTVRDLLHVDVDLDGVLPVDLAPGGFDTNVETLHFSSYLLDGYLAAADRVVDAAFASGQPPTRIKRRLDPKKEIATRRPDVYRHLDDGVAIFASDLASNTQIVFWKFGTRSRGEYRFRISAHAYQTDKAVLFHINGGTFNLGDPPFLIDHFETPPGKPTIIEFTAKLDAGKNIRLLVDTEIKPRELRRMGGAADYQGPGLVVQWVDVEGPLGDSWPPPSYRQLFGELPRERVSADPVQHEAVSRQPLADAEAILRKFTRRAFRRAVTDEDIKPYLERVRIQLDNGDSFQQAMRVGLKAVLVSPSFLFLRERIRPPDREALARGLAPPPTLDDFSLASRLSYFLWSSMPDDELLQLAEQGQLRRPATLHREVERMLHDAKATAFTENFAGQWLGLRELDATLPDRQLYPEYDELLRSSMVKEVYLFFEEVLKRDLSLTNFIASDFSMINQRLAEHYGIAGVQGLSFRKVALPVNSHRGGVMTMAAVLKVTANGTTTSPVVRGAWVLDHLLGAAPPRPPAGVEAVEPDIRGATTIRAQLAKHREVTSCAVCHARIDPPGFALENFDVIGGWREHYRSIGNGEPVTVAGRRMRYKHGPPVDASDVLPDGRRFHNIDEYKELLLADKDQLTRALAVKLLAYATGVPATTANRPQIEAIVAAVRRKKHGFRSLVHELVQSELFQSK